MPFDSFLPTVLYITVNRNKMADVNKNVSLSYHAAFKTYLCNRGNMVALYRQGLGKWINSVAHTHYNLFVPNTTLLGVCVCYVNMWLHYVLTSNTL